jgi:hypothetical protein
MPRENPRIKKVAKNNLRLSTNRTKKAETNTKTERIVADKRIPKLGKTKEPTKIPKINPNIIDNIIFAIRQFF